MPEPLKRVLITGQTGLNKGAWVDLLGQEIQKETGRPVKVFHTGDLMYEEAPDVPPGRILFILPERRETLARLAWERILSSINPDDIVLVNTHATFRWQHGMFSAFPDRKRLDRFQPDFFLNLVDNCHEVYARCHRHQAYKPSMFEVLMAREEEISQTQTAAKLLLDDDYYEKFAIIPKGQIPGRSVKTAARMILNPGVKRIYPSFPMTHVMDQPKILQQIDDFVSLMCKHLVCFPPGETDEFSVLVEAKKAKAAGKETFVCQIDGQPFDMPVDELLGAAKFIYMQIISRDYAFLRQVDMMASLYPVDANGKVAISTGVEQERGYTYWSGKESYPIWTSDRTPSPFVDMMAMDSVPSIDALVKLFQKKGYLPDPLP